MKIAYVYDAVYPWVKGGAEKRIYEISKRLAENHEVHWFGLKWWEGKRDIEINGVHLHGVGEYSNLYVSGRRSIREGILFGLKILLGFKGNFDFIDSQQSPYFPCFSSKIHSVINRSSLVITWYELWQNYWYEYLGLKGIFGKTVENLTLKLPDMLIPISERIRADLMSAGVPPEKTKVVPNGVDFGGIQEIDALENGNDIIYVGRLAEHKNVDLLLKAIKILKKDIPSIKCNIIGDGPERETLQKLMKKLDLDENVEFLGFLEEGEEVISFMKSAKVFVLPSTREGFPNTILEANACGLPAIIVKGEKNAAVDVVEDGKNGFVCDFSEEDIAAKILELLQDENKSEKMRDMSKTNAKKYDWSIIVNKMEKVYNELAG